MSTPEIDYGGPAFPIPGMPPVGTGDPRDGMAGGCDPQPGMSLRDWFAGQALAVMTAASDYSTGPCNHAIAERAYVIADLMLAIRKKGPQP